MHQIIQDLRYAARGLIKTPAFTLGVVVTLALGIGVNATMFGVVDALFLRAPAGVKDPDGVVRIYYRRTVGSMGTSTGPSSTFPSYTDLRDHVPGFERVAAITTTSLGLGRGADAKEVSVGVVSWEYFPLLGLQPALGRFFTDAEDRTGGDRVAVITYRYWQRQFGGDPGVIGKSLPLGKGVYTVIGVGPQDFGGIDLSPVEVFLPIHPAAEGDVASPEAIGGRGYWWLSLIARMKPGVAAQTAAAQATVAYRAGMSAGSRRDTTTRVLLGPIQEARRPELSSDARVAVWIGIVALAVLLIACANVANLLLARGVSRRREMAVRASLGAGRAGLIRALLAETLVLAAAGGAGAIALMFWVGAMARQFLLPNLPPDAPLVDGRVVLFTTAGILATTLLSGLVPAIQSSRTDLASALRSGGHGATGRGAVTRGLLLVTQIALTMVLLVGAGLFVRSLRKVQGIDTGFDMDRVYSVAMRLGTIGLGNTEANDAYLRLLDRIRLVPGVERAAASMGTPFRYAYAEEMRAEGVDSLPHIKTGGPYYQAVTPEYLATMGTRIVQGRDFDASDRAGAAPVTIVSSTFARMIWPGQSAIGKCLYRGNDSVTTCTRVVGVAADAKRGRVTETETLLYYVPFAQAKDPTINALLVRGHPGVRGLGPALAKEVQAAGNLPYATVQSLADQAAPQLRSWRLGASAFTAFGLLALLIAATGIFAVLSYGVSQRTKEIGVRVALGAQSAQVVRMVVGQGMRAAVIGATVGAVGAFALGRAIASLLYQVPPADPAVFVGVTVVLLSVAGAAAYLPARRASRVAPMIALRSE